MFSETGGSDSAGSTRLASAGGTAPASPSATVLVGLLGEVALRRDDALVPVPGARARLLVAALASHPGRSRSAAALIEDVWGEQPPRAPMNALHTQVSRLRSLLPEGALEIGPAGYRLVVTPDQVDLTCVEQCEIQARHAHNAGENRHCLGWIAAARTLWRGEPAADLPPGLVADELAGLAAAREKALDALELAAREAVGDLAGALELARRAVATDPFDEPAHATLMRLLAAVGRTNEALEVFAALRARLVDQLGADPGPELAALNTALLRGEPLPGSRASGTRNAATNQAAGQDDPSESSPAAAHSETHPVVWNEQSEADQVTRIGYGAGSGFPDGLSRPGGRAQGAVQSGFGAGEAISGRGSANSLRMAAAAHLASGLREPLESAASAIGLRAAPNPLLGREADLDALEALLRTSRVTTVLGPGGTGKTRVANELGARVAHEKTVALVELASLRVDPGGTADTQAEIEAAIATTLGVGDLSRENNVLRRTPARDVRRRLREALTSRPMLLILDNCEHLIDAVAEVVAELVGISDQLTVLTTSRAPLEITAETVYPLPPLTIDAHGSPATDLFVARARAVRPSVRVDPEVVARLCRTLDGLPLAIELAAARTRTMSVEEIESRLDHRFALLRSGDRSSPQRHRTLHAVIEWSWNLLDGPQRAALRRLCRFPAGFTLSAAEAVIAGPEIPDVATAIDGLVGQSLLTVLDSEDPEYSATRYRMLETVREFGEEQLVAKAEADLVMARMASWAAEFAYESARRYQIDDQVTVVLEVAAEIDNLVAVLRYAVDRGDIATAHAVFPVLSMLWVMRGAHMELISWGPRMLTLPLRSGPLTSTEADLQMFGVLVLGLHLMFLNSGTREVATVRSRIRRMLRRGGDLTPMFRFLGRLATVPIDPHKLARMLMEGVRSDDMRTRVAALLFRANMRENAGDLHGSIRDALHALDTGARNDVWGTAMLTQHLGSMYGQSARYPESVGYYREAIELLTRLRAYEESVEIRCLLAVALAGIGDLDQARRELEPALAGTGVEQIYDDGLAQPNHRRAAVSAALAEIELAEGDIEGGLRRFRRMIPLLDWPHGSMAPGPGDIMSVSAVLDAHVLHGESARMCHLAGEMVEVAVVRLGQQWDLPQLGAVAVAIGSYLLAVGRLTETALELLALAPRVLPRQDYPSMQWQRHVDLHRTAVGAERMAAAQLATVDIGRRRGSERIIELLRELDGNL